MYIFCFSARYFNNNVHGDVFKVEVKITLHVEEKNPEPEWETISKKRYVSSVNINEFILVAII